jgi:hypothetical protein
MMQYEILADGMVYYKNAINQTKETIYSIEYIQSELEKGVESAANPWHEWNGANAETEKFCLRHFLIDPKNVFKLDPLYGHISFIYENIFNGIENSYRHYSNEIYPHASQNIKSSEGMLSILKYGKTGYLPEHQDQGVSSRVLSTVAYLNDDYIGGEIYFPQVDVEIKPEAGSVIFFPSNFVFSHTVKPIIDGFRYAVPQWYHSLKIPRMSTGEV